MNPVQRPASTSDARKRRAERVEAVARAIAAADGSTSPDHVFSDGKPWWQAWIPEAEAALAALDAAAAVDWPDCPNHREFQHRDGKPPWCPDCGWNRGRPAIPPRQVKHVTPP